MKKIRRPKAFVRQSCLRAGVTAIAVSMALMLSERSMSQGDSGFDSQRTREVLSRYLYNEYVGYDYYSQWDIAQGSDVRVVTSRIVLRSDGSVERDTVEHKVVRFDEWGGISLVLDKLKNRGVHSFYSELSSEEPSVSLLYEVRKESDGAVVNEGYVCLDDQGVARSLIEVDLGSGMPSALVLMEYELENNAIVYANVWGREKSAMSISKEGLVWLRRENEDGSHDLLISIERDSTGLPVLQCDKSFPPILSTFSTRHGMEGGLVVQRYGYASDACDTTEIVDVEPSDSTLATFDSRGRLVRQTRWAGKYRWFETSYHYE